MKILKVIFGLFLIFVIGNVVSSCNKDKDDEPANNSIYGVWAEIENPKHFPMLVTSDCMVMDDTGAGASVLLPYVKASYETLKDRFAPNDEFFVYRYDSKNNVYILYSGDDEADDGTILFATGYPVLMRATVSNDILECQYQWPELDYDENVTREELLSNSKYASVPSDVKIHFEQVRTYKKVK